MKKPLLLLLAPALLAASCSNNEPNPDSPDIPSSVVVPGEGSTPSYDPSKAPTFNYAVPAYAGETATDAPSYPDNDADLNPALTQWTDVITVTFNGSTATVDGAGATISGANVDLALPATGLCRVVVTGTSPNGSLRLSGTRKHMLELRDLTLTSTDRPAINDQVKKRVFVSLSGRNVLADGTAYAPSTEDRKGCFFSESHVILGGSGVLEIKGNYRHGFATDGFLFVNPGATLVVTDAVKNAIHVKGSASENNSLRGIEIVGGYVFAHTSGAAGKAIRCDAAVRLRGGDIVLSSSGSAAWDATDGTLSSPACIKGDLGVYLSGARISLVASGSGAKAINADGNLSISGGDLSIAMTGTSHTERGDSSTPKGLACKGQLQISGGGIAVSTIGKDSRAIDADGGMNVSGGVTYAFGRDYGLRFLNSATVSGGVLLAGGARNSELGGVSSFSYSDVEAERLTLITTDEGDALLASFRWPVAMPVASLLLHR